MKRFAIGAGVLAIAVVLIGWAFQVPAPQRESSLASVMPQGAALFLEAKDLSSLLREWGASPEKQAWLKSDNYATFSRSRLFLRLQQVQKEFETAAGIPPNMGFLNEVAGQHAALGLYDIGKLELVYITHLPSAQATQSALWQKRSQFEPRQAAGQQFFVRTDPESGRVAAFAIVGDRLILGTREDLVAGALSLLAGQKLARLSDEKWFVDAIAAAPKDAGDLRMAIHLADATRTPQFRTYWVQRNVTEIRQYESSVSDLYRSATEYREERVLLPKEPPPDSSADAQRVADLLRLVPPDTGFYRATTLNAQRALGLLEEKVLTPRLGPAPPSKVAPVVGLGDAKVGSDADLETRIDTAPSANTTENKADDALSTALVAANVRAALELHRSEVTSDGLFVRLRSTVVVSGAADFDEQGAREAIQRLVAPAITTSRLGAGWKTIGSGAQAHAEFDGLLPIAVAVRGKYLVVGNDSETIAAVLARLREPMKAQPVVYDAAFDHARERQNFYRFAALVDRPARSQGLGSMPPGGREPEFFSQNLSSLSEVFAGVKSQRITVRRDGAKEMQTVVYEWAR